MTRIARIAALLALLVMCSSAVGSAGAQESAPTWRVATGRTQKADGSWADPKPFTAEARQELVQGIVREIAQADVTRDWQAAAKKLEMWGALTSWSGVPDRESLLEHIALRKVELYERFGRTREALAAVEGVLVRADVLLPVGETTARGTWGVLDGIELKDATAEDLALQARVLATPYVSANRERLRKLVQQPADDDGVSKVVGNAIFAGDRNQVLELGKRAVPALRKRVARDTNEWVAESNDPLSMLTAADEAAAAAAILEHFDNGGTFWRRRALRAMKNEQVLWDAGTYAHDPQTNAKATLLEPWWPPVVLRFLQEPETAQDSLVLVTSLARADALDAKLVATISGLLRTGDASMVSGLQQLLAASLGAEGTRTILESMLESPDASQREFAANGLLRYRETPRLWANARAADPVVRLAAARSFDHRQVFNGQYNYDANGGFPLNGLTVAYRAPLTPESLSVLETLLADADTEIREAASQALRQNGVVLSADTWLALAKDPSVQVREDASKSLFQAPVDVSARVLAVLAADTEPSVLGNALSLLRDLASSKKAPVDIDRILEPIRILRENPRRSSVNNLEGWLGNLYPRMLETQAGRSLVAKWALAGEGTAGSTLAGDIHAQLVKLQKDGAPARAPVERASVGIPFDDAKLCEFLSAFAAGSRDPVEGIAVRLESVRIVDVAPWRALATDAQKPMWLRLYAFALLVDRFGDGYVDALTSALSTAGEIRGGHLSQSVQYLFGRLPIEPARAVLEGVLRARPVPALAGEVTEAYALAHAMNSASADAVLAAALVERAEFRAWKGPVDALRQVATRPPAEQGDWFEKAVRNRGFARTAVQILGDLREPKYRSLLVSALDPTLLTDDGDRIALQKDAIAAIGRYLDDEAVEILLDAAGRLAPDDLRTACYDALKRIQTHREQRAAWEQRKRAGATKDAAINELVKVLESADANLRAQAVRSLATLGAVEELPRILQLLKDKDAGVREAAQRALDVLNASTAAPR